MTSILKTNAIEPQSGTTLTIGQSGQNVVVNADSIKNNVIKDAGGNAIFTSNGSGVDPDSALREKSGKIEIVEVDVPGTGRP